MICITGSNGKTTTTSLIYHIIKKLKNILKQDITQVYVGAVSYTHLSERVWPFRWLKLLISTTSSS